MIVSEPSNNFLKKFFARSPFSRAFLAVGEGESHEKLLQALVERLCRNVEPPAFDIAFEHPVLQMLDMHRYDGEALHIDAAREIHEKAHQTSWTGAKIFLIRCGYISGEAQAVLLKTLEEPSANTYFIITAKSEAAFSAPLLSRLTTLKAAKTKLQETGYKLEERAPTSLKKELEEAAEAAKERASAEKFLDTLEIWAHNEMKGGRRDSVKLARFIKDLLETKAKFFERTYFTRMLLEHIVISRAYLRSTI